MTGAGSAEAFAEDGGWVRLGPTRPVRVRESDVIRLRGLAPRSRVTIGLSEVAVGTDGCAALRPAEDDHLAGHVGLIDVVSGGVRLGEVELVPHKMSEPAYAVLRAELHRVWTDLALDPDSISSVRAGLPPARELWRRIDRAVIAIVQQPLARLDVTLEPRRLERVRHRRDLSSALMRASARGRPALVRTIRPSTDTPENHLCAATLRLLRSHARRDTTADDVVRAIDRVLANPLFAGSGRPSTGVTWGMRSDPRYRRVHAVHRLLRRPELEPTEGPGELRLGVAALSRLYEYWVFLQVLVAATRQYGRPEGPGFAQLAVPVAGGRHRLDIPRGTTVTFPGPVHVAFEPELRPGGGWMGVDYAPHPDPQRAQVRATPDVLVFRATAEPALLVIDAKYVGRNLVELAAARIHEKYGRLLVADATVPNRVLAVHPHRGFGRNWAGYGHMALTPGQPTPGIPLPRINPTRRAAGAIAVRESPLPAPRAAPRSEPRVEVSVIADQYWMRRQLDGRRIDLGALLDRVSLDHDILRSEVVMPDIDQLAGFAGAAERSGWDVTWLESVERPAQIDALVELIARRAEEGRVLVISADPGLRRAAGGLDVEWFTRLDQVSSL